MIAINELRQGNIVWHNYGNTGEIIAWKWTTFCDIEYAVKVIDPVPITDEWLDKLGLKSGAAIWEAKGGVLKLKMYKNFIRDGSGRFEGVTFTQMIGALTEHSIRNVCCKYIHELQNFYFVFTGQELTIKL